MRFIQLLFLCALFLSSCESSESKVCTTCDAEGHALTDSDSLATNENISKEDKTIAQTNGDNLVQSKQSKKNTKDKKANHLKIVQKYGEQWDFCLCVAANDSINKASQKGLTEKQAEKLMKRWEFVETKCKEFMTNPNTTPDERALHERKVEKCLGGKLK